MAWIRNNSTRELWVLNTTTDLPHLSEEWEVAECNARPCIEDVGPGGGAYRRCSVELPPSDAGARDAD